MAENITEYLQGLADTVGDLASTQADQQIKQDREHTIKVQDMALPFFTKALCVDTRDFRKEYRVRFYHPLLHKPDTPLTSLPFASPISPMGGIDDSGLSWVPPAGSILCLIFENGDRDAPHYLGTSWQRARDPVPSKEYQQLYTDRATNYYLKPSNDDNSFEELPPWNTESYNNYDYTDTSSFAHNREEQVNFTMPNIYGFKTPEKHMFKMVDGDPKCNRRNKRIEILSGGGQWMMFKDDHLHYGGQWAQGKGTSIAQCSTANGDEPYITDPFGKPIEGSNNCGETTLGGRTSTPGNPPEPPTEFFESQKGSNPYFKYKNEQRPYDGPRTSQNNKCDLPQSGWQLLTASGHTIVADDSVEEPRGKPDWQRSLEPFDYGCTDRYMGRFYIRTAHGHEFAMSDHESSSSVRSDKNYIRMKSALGNRIELNDHSIGEDSCKHAGPSRGVVIESTSKHKLSFVDDRNDHCGLDRRGGAEPINKATNAYVKLESGYGSSLEFGDNNSQEETQNQYVRLMNPQSGPGEDPNKSEFGPHIFRMQAHPQRTPGVVYLRAGGYHLRQTTHDDVIIVGDDELNPEGANKYTYVTKDHSIVAEGVNFSYAGKQHVVFSEDKILLLAGRDCDPAEGKKCNGPCLYPVIIARCPIKCPLTKILHFSDYSISERVFASGKQIDCSSGDPINPTGGGEGCSEDNEDNNSDNSINTGEGEIVAGSGG